MFLGCKFSVKLSAISNSTAWLSLTEHHNTSEKELRDHNSVVEALDMATHPDMK